MGEIKEFFKIMKIKKLISDISEKKYQIVAYNNRMYKGFRYVTFIPMTFIQTKNWITDHGDETRYIYDLYDIKTCKMKYNYSQMLKDYNYIKKVIKNENNNFSHMQPLKEYIFAFKNK